LSVLLILLLCVPLAVAALAVSHRRERGVDEWRAAAHELGLTLTGGEEARSMGGVLNGVPVRVDFRRKLLHGKRGTEAAVDYLGDDETTSFFAGRLPPLGAFARRLGLQRSEGSAYAGIPETLAVREESLARSLGLVGGRDETSGDAQFDALVELPGMDAYVCAALSFTARQQLHALMERGGQVHKGRVEFERRVPVSHDRNWLVLLCKSLSRLGNALSVTPDSLHGRLADNATHDPIAGVRLKNLHFLTDPSTRTPEGLVASTARAVLSDVSAPVRLLAARQLPAEGGPVLRALVTDARLGTGLRVEALQALDERGVPEAALLSTLLSTAPPELATAALSVIVARRLEGLSVAVVECAHQEHAGVRAAAARALGTLPVADAQGVLLRLLSDPSADVQYASAESLGAIGSVAAVERLLPVAEGLGRTQLRQAARAAIGRIQSRLGHVEAGRISLADERSLAGALALAEAPALRVGELSLADPLSLTAESSAAGDDELNPASQELVSRAPRT
jgi:hypothetical protein